MEEVQVLQALLELANEARRASLQSVHAAVVVGRNALRDVEEALGIGVAVERAVSATWRTLGRENVSVVVTADHGQAFYEKGFLGHAQDVDEDDGVGLVSQKRIS